MGALISTINTHFQIHMKPRLYHHIQPLGMTILKILQIQVAG
jgi:hypothetical protein